LQRAATSLARGEVWALPAELDTVLSLAWLVLAGSAGLFQLWLHIIRRWSASATTFAIAPMTVVAAVLGVVVLDQPITAGLVAGGALVLSAVYLGARKT
jgi:drug/metabolite transporter (DMT)-like permease